MTSRRAFSGNLGCERWIAHAQGASLAAHIVNAHPGTSYGGYSCRPNTANNRQMSVHGTGRAFDLFVPKVNNDANNAVGDTIGNWLVLNADRLGMQYVIWDRTCWGAQRSERPYRGPVPHTDHLHVELTSDGAAQRASWYKDHVSR